VLGGGGRDPSPNAEHADDLMDDFMIDHDLVDPEIIKRWVHPVSRLTDRAVS